MPSPIKTVCNGSRNTADHCKMKFKLFSGTISVQYKRTEELDSLRPGLLNPASSPEFKAKILNSKVYRSPAALTEETMFEILSDLSDPQELESLGNVEDSMSPLQPDFSVYQFWTAQDSISDYVSYDTQLTESVLESRGGSTESPFFLDYCSSYNVEGRGQQELAMSQNPIPDFAEYSDPEEKNHEQLLHSSEMSIGAYQGKSTFCQSDNSALFLIKDEHFTQQRESTANSGNRFSVCYGNGEAIYPILQDKPHSTTSLADSGNQEYMLEDLEAESITKLVPVCKRKRGGRPLKQRIDKAGESSSRWERKSYFSLNEGLQMQVKNPKKSSKSQKRKKRPGHRNSKKRSGPLPAEGLIVLQAWLADHLENAYPTAEQKQLLVQSTGLTLDQVNNWLANSRHKLKLQRPLKR